MVEVSSETADKIEDIAARSEKDVEDVKEEFRKQHEDVSQRASGWSEEKIEEFALRRTRTELLKKDRTNSQEIEMLVIGGDVREGRNGDYFNGTALVDTNPDEDTGRNRLGEIIVNDESVIPEVYEGFNQVGNIVRGNFSVSDGDLEGHVRVFSSDDTDEVKVSRPDNREPLYDQIREQVPEFTIENVADNLTEQTRDEDSGNLYPITSDVRRIEADIFDGYKNPSEGNGSYTIRDDTVFDEDDIARSDVFDAENANENATPGMTCWTDPAKMEFGSGSVCEFIGVVSQNDNGIVSMNVHGIIPILTKEWDGYTDERSTKNTQSSMDTSNVDKMTV